jgi:hypothetical protein
MEILKSKLEYLIKELPEKIDLEDVMYRIYMLQKIETGEKDVAEGRTLLHKDAVERLTKKWQK